MMIDFILRFEGRKNQAIDSKGKNLMLQIQQKKILKFRYETVY